MSGVLRAQWTWCLLVIKGSATTVLNDAVAAHAVEPVPSCKQCAIIRVQEEEDLDDYDAVAMINIFQSDVTIADSYNNITRDGIRKIFLAQHLRESRRWWANEQELL